MRLYREKPKEPVKVVLWNGTNKAEILNFLGDLAAFIPLPPKEKNGETKELLILKPNSIVYEGQYLVKTSKYFFSIYSPDELNKKYERLDFEWWNTK